MYIKTFVHTQYDTTLYAFRLDVGVKYIYMDSEFTTVCNGSSFMLSTYVHVPPYCKQLQNFIWEKRDAQK